MTESIPGRLRDAFEPQRSLSAAVPMAAYMRNLFPFLGIQSSERRALQKRALAGTQRPAEPELIAAANELWESREREYQYAAVDLLSSNTGAMTPRFLPVAQRLVTSKSWWDTVDALAIHVVGPLVARFPDLAPVMDAWAASDNVWLVRSAILHQNAYKRNTDAERLFRYCLLRAPDSEFFIRKAIGWALREYSKVDGEAVRNFVHDHEQELSRLSRREALLWLNGGRRKRAD